MVTCTIIRKPAARLNQSSRSIGFCNQLSRRPMGATATSQFFGIDFREHLARERVGELVDVAADPFRYRAPALDRLLVVVDDNGRVLHAEALGGCDVGFALNLLVPFW